MLPDEESASVGLVGWKRKSKPGGRFVARWRLICEGRLVWFVLAESKGGGCSADCSSEGKWRWVKAEVGAAKEIMRKCRDEGKREKIGCGLEGKWSRCGLGGEEDGGTGWRGREAEGKWPCVGEL